MKDKVTKINQPDGESQRIMNLKFGAYPGNKHTLCVSPVLKIGSPVLKIGSAGIILALILELEAISALGKRAFEMGNHGFLNWASTNVGSISLGKVFFACHDWHADS